MNFYNENLRFSKWYFKSYDFISGSILTGPQGSPGVQLTIVSPQLLCGCLATAFEDFLEEIPRRFTQVILVPAFWGYLLNMGNVVGGKDIGDHVVLSCDFTCERTWPQGL